MRSEAVAAADKLLGGAKRIHFIGIGGSGMCPIAEILIQRGFTVTGSDNNPGDNLEKLKSLGAEIYMGQKAEHIDRARPDLIVFTAALLPDNEELRAAKESGIPTFERAELFGSLSRMYDNCICVCGTHGKTTVTSLLSHIFLKEQRDPTLLIGGRLPLIDSHGRFGKSDTMICEACEYKDTFLRLSPDCSVILNIDRDHMEYFKTLERLKASFRAFADLTTKLIIFNGDDENTVSALSGIKTGEGKRLISFGFSDTNDYCASGLSFKDGAFAEFDIYRYGEKVGHTALSIPGRHNILNALAAIAAADANGIPVSSSAKIIPSFKGAGRRFEILGSFGGITIADDYAHHPAELEAVLGAAMKMPYKRVIAVFQPFTYSRTAMLEEDFIRVLSLPSKVIITEIMGSREKNTFGVDSRKLCEKIEGASFAKTLDEAASLAVKEAKAGDLILTLGCGDVYKAAGKMVDYYAEENGAEN